MTHRVQYAWHLVAGASLWLSNMYRKCCAESKHVHVQLDSGRACMCCSGPRVPGMCTCLHAPELSRIALRQVLNLVQHSAH